MKHVTALLCAAFFTLAPAQTGLGDVKFYNLEKEYVKTVTYLYKVKNAQALELKQIVDDMLSIYGSLYINENSNELYLTDTEEKITDLKTILPGLDIGGIKAGNNLVSKTVYLKHGSVEEVTDIIRHKLSPDGSVYEVIALNALVITDVESKIREVEGLLSQIDVPVAHIGIEITAIEFNNEYFSKLGINIFNWLQGLSADGELFYNSKDNARGSVVLRSGTEPRSPETGAQYIDQADRDKSFHLRANLNVGDLVNFISENADGSVLASTRVVTRNNKEASINAREIIPARMFENQAADQAPYTSIAVEGLWMRVTPTLQQDSLINLKILPTISDLTGWSPKGLPIIFERTLNTEVKVKNNSIFVLGGLKKKESVNIRTGVPILKDIPIIQYLFSTKKRIILEREVLIFIRPSTDAGTAVSAENFEKLMERYGKEKN